MDNLDTVRQEEAAYAYLDSAQPEIKQGYADGAGHEFLASQHSRLLTRTEDAEVDGLAEGTRSLARETLKLQLALDASDTLSKASEEYIKIASKLGEDTRLPLDAVSMRLTAQKEAALAFPEKAAASAVVEMNAPLDMPEKTKTVKAFQEYQLYTVSSLVGDKAWIFSRDSYALDLASLMVNPVRTIFGQGRAGKELGLSRTGYYAFVNEWHALPQSVQEAQWDSVVGRLKEASGDNDLVFFGLVNPLIYPQEETAPYVDAAFDILDFGITVGAWRLAKLLKTKLSYRGRALMHGNDVEAGKATAQGIKAGDMDAVVDGHPIPNPEGLSGLSPPTQLHIVEELRAQGKLDVGEDLVSRGIPLTSDEVPLAVAKRRDALVATGARVVGEDVNPAGVTFTFEVQRPGPKVTVTDIQRAQRKIEALLKEATQERKLLIAGSKPGENTEQVAELTARIDKLRAHEDQVLGAAASGKTEVVLEGPTTPIVKQTTMLFTEDDVGRLNFKDTNIGFYTHFFGTPESRVGKLMDGLVSYATSMRQQQRRLFGYFDKDVRALRKALKGDEGLEVDNLLLTGDRLQKRYTPDELKAGVNVDGVGFISFNDKQIEGYQRLRRAYDDLYVLANRMQRDELVFGGYETFFAKLLDKAGAPVKDIKLFGKTNKISFTPPVNGYKHRVASVVDLRSVAGVRGAPVKLSSILDLDKNLTARKYGFVELRYPVVQGDGGKYAYALVDVDEVAGVRRARGASTPDQVLDYRVGYTPKLAQENVRWVVERQKGIIVDGVRVSDSQIVRGFETEAEADIFLKDMAARGKGKKLSKQQITPDWRSDVKNKEKVEFIDNSLFRGAFVGHRFDNSKFKIGLDGREATRVSSFDALQRYADYVAAYTPMHQYKQAMIQRFIKSTYGPNKKAMLSIVGKWDSPLNGSGDEWARLKAVQDWMKATFAVPTTEEHFFAKFTDKMLGFLEKAIYNIPEGRQRKGTDSLKALHHWIATSRSAQDPVSFMKGVTFDLMLGTFNPAQFFVQSAGMFIPTTLHPIEATKAMPDFLFLRNGMHFSDYNQAAEAASKLGFNKKRMATMLHAWHRSGIPDSILENADFGHYAGTHGAYYSPSMVNTLRENSRFFYNHGELNNRMFSFIMAFNRKASDRGWDLTKKLSESQLQEVVQEALRIGTNMTAANKAKWQDGILGMPTQFWQQTHKYYENLFYGLAPEGMKKKLGIYKENQWTKTESMVALGMNMLMFGAAGYGLDDWWENFDRWVVGKDGLALDPETDRNAIAFLRGGFAEMILLEGLGFELDIADRVGPASGSNIMFDKLFKPLSVAAMEGKLGEALGTALLGPTNTTINRTIDAGKRFVALMAADTQNLSWDMNSLVATAMEISSVSTSITNLERALAWKKANDILSTKNMPLYIIENGTEVPTSLVLLKALGFDPLAKEKMEKLLRQKVISDKDKASMARNLADEYRRYFLAKSDGTLIPEVQRVTIQRRIALRKEAIAEVFGEKAANDIMANVIKLLNEEEYGNGRDYQKYLFESILAATPESEREKQLRSDWVIAQELAKIKGQDLDAE